jgi:hypothetical protein
VLFRRRHPLLQPLPSGGGSLGAAPQAVGQGFTLLLEVEHVAVARGIPQGGALSGPQALARIGDGVVRTEPLRLGVQQVYAPGVAVAVLPLGQEITVG